MGFAEDRGALFELPEADPNSADVRTLKALAEIVLEQKGEDSLGNDGTNASANVLQSYIDRPHVPVSTESLEALLDDIGVRITKLEPIPPLSKACSGDTRMFELHSDEAPLLESGCDLFSCTGITADRGPLPISRIDEHHLTRLNDKRAEQGDLPDLDLPASCPLKRGGGSTSDCGDCDFLIDPEDNLPDQVSGYETWVTIGEIDEPMLVSA